jgi:putative endonuclease
MWHVYIIKCKSNKLYTGITNNIERRLAKHNSGKGGRFTRSWKPVKLIYSKKVRNRSSALKKEAAIKKLNRNEKLDLVKKY